MTFDKKIIAQTRYKVDKLQPRIRGLSPSRPLL